MKLNRPMKLIALFALSVLVIMAMALVFSQSTSANTNWPKNDNGDPDPFSNVTFDPEGGELNIYKDEGAWVVEDGDDISYSGISTGDPPVPGELGINMEHDITIETGGILTLENVRLVFTHNDSTYGYYEIGGDGTFVGKNLSVEHDIIIDGDVVIGTDTTYSNLANETRILILGNLTIQDGATLTLDDVSLQTDAGEYVNKVMIEEGGSLVMQNGAVLESLSTISEDVLIYTLDAQGTLDVTDSVIRNHGILIVNSDASIRDSFVSSSDNSPFTTITIMGDGITPTIQGTDIESSNDMGVGIYVADGTEPSIIGNTFIAGPNDGFAGGNPILVEGKDCNPDIDDNYFGGGNREILSFGIKTVGCLPQGGGEPLEDANTFDANYGKRHLEVYWYITVTVEDKDAKGLSDVDVNCEEQDKNYNISDTTDETGVVVFELLDYKVQKSGTVEYGTCDVTASKEGETNTKEDVSVDDNDDFTLTLQITAYDYWPHVNEDQFTESPMTLGMPYTFDLIINNEGYANDGTVTVNVYIDGTLAGTDDILVDTANKAVNNFDLDVPAGAAKESDFMVEIVFVGEANTDNNDVTVEDVYINSAPTVTITAPAMDAKVVEDVTIEGTYADGDGLDNVTAVMVRIDGGEWEDADLDEGDWDYTWSTMDTDNDDFMIEVAAWDGLDIMSDIAKVNVTVENLPAISIDAIEGELGEGEDVIQVDNLINGETDTSKKITGTATPSVYSEYDIMRVNITIKHLIGGSLEDEIIINDKGTTDTSGDDTWTTWEYSWTGKNGSINNLADGEYEITATVYDEEGFTATATYTIMVMAENVDTDPLVAITTDDDPFNLTQTTNTVTGTVVDDFINEDWFEVVYRIGTSGDWDPVDEGLEDWSIDLSKNVLEEDETGTLYVRAFDGQAWSSEATLAIARPGTSLDLSVTSVTASSTKPQAGVPITLTIVITKTGVGTALGVDIVAYMGPTDDYKLGELNEDIINSTKTFQMVVLPSDAHAAENLKDIRVVVDPYEEINDPVRADNVKTVTTDIVKVAAASDDDDDDDPVPAFTFTVIALVSVAFFVARRRR